MKSTTKATKAQEQAQFDWLQERLGDPNFCGIVLSGNGEFFSVSTLRVIKSAEELARLIPAESFPLIPIAETEKAP